MQCGAICACVYHTSLARIAMRDPPRYFFHYELHASRTPYISQEGLRRCPCTCVLNTMFPSEALR